MTRKMKFLTLLKVSTLLTLAFAGSSTGAENIVERWECNDLLSTVMVELTADHQNEKGTIKSNGLPEIITVFYIDGLERRWQWETSRGYFGFIISAGGRGAYYKWPEDGSAVKPTHLFPICGQLG